MSGWITNKKIIGRIAIKLMTYLKKILKFFSIHKIVAIKIMTKGFTSSIG